MGQIKVVAMRRAILKVLLLAVVSSNAMAEWGAGWVRVGNSGGDMTPYANPATIIRDGDIVKVWYLYDFKNVQEGAGDRYMSSTFQGEYDCKEVKGRVLAYTWYSENMGGGNVIYTETSPANWSPVFPGSVEEAVLKYACGKKWWKWW
jgi:hypothetical protein